MVVFSGGQDSTTCLLWALERFDDVEAVSFDYGQRHGSCELGCARDIAGELGVSLTTLPLDLSCLHGNSLTDLSVEVDGGGDGLPNSFVPGRNILFLTMAAALATSRGYADLVAGVCQADYSGYPDCREETITSVALTYRLGTGVPLKIHTPIMHLTKAQTWSLAADLGGLELVRTRTHTCYNGARDECHDWGFGCGECPACALRARGWAEYVNNG